MAKFDKHKIIKGDPANPADIIRKLAAEGSLKGVATVHLAFEKGKCHVLADYVGEVDIERFPDGFAYGASELASYIRNKDKDTTH